MVFLGFGLYIFGRTNTQSETTEYYSLDVLEDATTADIFSSIEMIPLESLQSLSNKLGNIVLSKSNGISKNS